MTLEEYEHRIHWFIDGYSKYYDFTDDPKFKELLPEINLRNPEFILAMNQYLIARRTMHSVLKSIVIGDGE